ncbi:hypothetical protein HU200_001237 [Digitaria exilis]|uniref:No apical meristem-associated C-terminal domain-containing protein n=1 Tax=Digitaria exilis TaxID=1010633 RepID=A0A835G0C1_9POAL|nr:hypothetical protein HU200_001237 [Digitaria exilis]
MNMPAQARMAAGPQAASPSLAPAPQATPGSIPPTATWLPPAFVPNSSSQMVHTSDLNATDAAIQEGCIDYLYEEDTGLYPKCSDMAICPAPYAPFEAPQPWLAKDKSSPSAPKQDTNSSLGSQDQPKWHAYNEDLNGSSKRKSSESEAVDLTSSPNVVNNLPRPGGCKKAKEEERGGKGKGKGSSSTMDEIDKLREVQAKSKEDHIEVLERHQQIAAAKKESAKLNHLAAQEKKEAKLLEKEGKMHDKESKLLETYKSLLTFDTSQMSEDLRAKHMIAVKTMRERIFATRAS